MTTRQLPEFEELFDFTDPQSASTFLTERPESAFFSFQDQSPFGKAPSARRAFDRSFQEIQNRFFGEQGRRAREGGTSQTFLSFLEGTKDVAGRVDSPGELTSKGGGLSAARRRFLSQGPTQRGDFSAFLNPRTRFLVNF